MHGGIGFTWEHPAHLYLKRAKADSIAFGTAGRAPGRAGVPGQPARAMTGERRQDVTAVPAEDELRRRVAGLSLEQKVRLLTGADFWALYAGTRRRAAPGS